MHNWPMQPMLELCGGQLDLDPLNSKRVYLAKFTKRTVHRINWKNLASKGNVSANHFPMNKKYKNLRSVIHLNEIFHQENNEQWIARVPDVYVFFAHRFMLCYILRVGLTHHKYWKYSPQLKTALLETSLNRRAWSPLKLKFLKTIFHIKRTDLRAQFITFKSPMAAIYWIFRHLPEKYCFLQTLRDSHCWNVMKTGNVNLHKTNLPSFPYQPNPKEMWRTKGESKL